MAESVTYDEKMLKVAELLNEGHKYDEIIEYMKDKGGVSSKTIAEVNKDRMSGKVQFTEDGKAYVAKPKEFTEIHAKLVEVVTKKATEDALTKAEEDYMLGREVREFWGAKARDLGMDLRDLIKGAISFYDDYYKKMEEFEKLREIAREAVEHLNNHTIKEHRLTLYYKFMRDVLQHKANGYIIPQQVVDDFYADLIHIGETIELKLPFVEEEIEVAGEKEA